MTAPSVKLTESFSVKLAFAFNRWIGVKSIVSSNGQKQIGNHIRLFRAETPHIVKDIFITKQRISFNHQVTLTRKSRAFAGAANIFSWKKFTGYLLPTISLNIYFAYLIRYLYKSTSRYHAKPSLLATFCAVISAT